MSHATEDEPDEPPVPAPRRPGSGEHLHRRASDADSHRHHRVDDTPENGIKLSSKGITFPWGKIVAGFMALGTMVTGGATTFAVTRMPTPAATPTETLSVEGKLDLLLQGVARIERKADALDERQRALELKVATLQAREEKGK